MYRKKKPVLFLFLLIFVVNSFSQIAVGQWRDHLPFSRALQVVEGGDYIYCLTDGGLFYYNKSDNSVRKLTKVNGLSDVGMSTIQYNEQYGLLLAGYSNANIDILKNNEIINISDIKRKQILGSKSINNIKFIGKNAYLSCGFGIVVVDIEKYEIKSTYYIGSNGSQLNINEIAFDGTNLYAATDKGIYKGDINNLFLENYQNWTKITNIRNSDSKFNTIVYFNNKIITNYCSGTWNKDTMYISNNNTWAIFDTSHIENKSNTTRLISYKNKLYNIKGYYAVIYDTSYSNKTIAYNYIDSKYSFSNSAVTDNSGQIWIADDSYGLVKYTGPFSQSINPTGPGSKSAVYMNCEGDELCVVRGGKNLSLNNMWNTGAAYIFSNETWKNYTKTNIPQFDTIYDLAVIKINPNNINQIFIGAWGSGIVEFNNGQFTRLYNQYNSTLQNALSSGAYIRIGGMTFDAEGNLWVTNCQVQNVISVRKPDGTWVGLDYKNIVKSDYIGEIIVTRDNNKWAILPRGEGLFVFNNGTSLASIGDDKLRKFDINDENGALISNNVFAIAEDLNGDIWVGTDQGVAVYYNPSEVFTKQDFHAQRVKLPSDIPGLANYLLGNEVVTCIAIDGANRKWFGTANAGVFLMSEDGTNQILNFNVDNSPLLSNEIMSIAINNVTGEVFFGTSEGIISYKGTATLGKENFDDVFIYPNPVGHNYTGLITVKGLVTNSNVKITDISGNIVFETKAAGGQAIWNGKNFSGQKVKTGVYLVFCTNEDGSKSHVTKLLFLN